MKRILILTFIIWCSCDSEKKSFSGEEVVFFKNSDEPAEFENVFSLADSFSFDFGSDTARVVPAVWRLLVSEDGDLFTFNNGSIAQFTSQGKFLADIGNRGQGPGEFNSITDYNIDDENNIWVADGAEMRMSVFRPENNRYNFYDAFNTDGTNVDKFIVIDSSLIGYSNYHDFLITRYSLTGQKMNEYFPVEDGRQRSFLARFNGGGICRGFHGNHFYAVYPGNYEIREFSLDTGLVRVYRDSSGKESPFRISPPDFPLNLDPYDMTDKHTDWYESFLHIESVFTLDPDVIGVVVFDEIMRRSRTTYINLYDTRGNSIVEGVRLPDHSRFVGGNKDFFYLALDESLRTDGSIKPLVIEKYKLHPSLLTVR